MSFFRNSLMAKFLTGVACVAGLTALAAVMSSPAAEPTVHAAAPAPGVAVMFNTP
jgi:hypothetical protein